MARFNTGSHRTQPAVATVTSPMRTSGGVPTARTFEGAPAWNKDARTDLFQRTTSKFAGGEKSFYESGEERDNKIVELTRQLAVEDPDWVFEFARWLRGPGNIRTAALMIACEFVKARLAEEKRLGSVPGPAAVALRGDAGLNRRIIDAVCQRPDEPGEILAYWTTRYGRRVPKPIKRGLADAAQRLYSERSLLKYDTASHAYRFADVLELCHPSPDPGKAWQGDLFKYAIDRRQGNANDIPASLAVIQHNGWLRAQAEIDPAIMLSSEQLYHAGVTWEDALATVGDKVDRGKLWDALIPNMGYMATLRNLRNFDQADLSKESVNRVVAKLMDEQEVARSRQLPFRFYAAYKNTESLRWAHALETALDLCLPNIPELSGRTLVLVDTSGSMRQSVSGRSQMACVEAAALFGSAIALKNPDRTDLVQFADTTAAFDVHKGGSTLRLTATIMHSVGQVGGGTEMAGAIRQRYKNHDRVILLSDMQAFGGHWSRNVGDGVPAHVPIYCFNISSYSASPLPTGDKARFDLGGLGDATFALIPQLEAGRNGTWPWESTEDA